VVPTHLNRILLTPYNEFAPAAANSDDDITDFPLEDYILNDVDFI